MKLKDVVRGVVEKDSPKGEGCICGAHGECECGCPDANWKDNDGYNSLANTEVVVDRDKMAEEIYKTMTNSLTVKEWDLDYPHVIKMKKPYTYKDLCLKSSQAIATAIESGSIIKLKEEI